MTAASGTAAPGTNTRTWGSQNSTAITNPRQARFPPAQADYRLPAARLKDALRAPAYAGQILDPAARSHEPAAIRGKHNQRGSYPTPGKHGRSAKPQVIPT